MEIATLGSSSWMSYASEGIKGLDDDDDVTNVYKNGGSNRECTEYNTDMPLLLNILKNLQIKLKITQRRFFQKWKSKNRPSICTQTRESLAPGKTKNTYMDTEEAHGDM